MTDETRKELREKLKEQIIIMADVIKAMEPQNYQELIAVALPNLDIFVHELLSQAIQQERETLREKIKNIPNRYSSIDGFQTVRLPEVLEILGEDFGALPESDYDVEEIINNKHEV